MNEAIILEIKDVTAKTKQEKMFGLGVGERLENKKELLEIKNTSLK